MSIRGLHKLFFPSSVAVMGIDEDSNSLGRRILTNIVASNFKGSVYPICETMAAVDGLSAHASLAAVGRPVDLAVLALPLEQVPAAIDVCGQAGVSGVVILARNGSAERTASAILQRARATGVRAIGPRSWGIVSPWTGLNTGLGQQTPLAGELAVISQSAAVCASILDLSVTKQIGLSLLAGLGDMLEVDCADLMDYTANHFRVKAILLHVEHISDMRKFMSAARAASRVKPVVVLKTGRAASPAAGTTTDSASLFGEDAVYDAAFKRAGIVRVATVEELFDCGDLLSKQPPPRGPSLAIVTHARSPGVMAVDALQDHGLKPARFDEETAAAVGRLLGSAWDGRNPVTVRADVPPDHYGKLVGIGLAAQGVDGVLIILTPRFLYQPEEVARAVCRAVARKTRPVFAVWMGGKDMETGRRLLDEAGIPTYDAPERAVRAFWNLYAYDRNIRLLQEIPLRLSGRFSVNRNRARAVINTALQAENFMLRGWPCLNLLQAYDIPLAAAQPCRSVEEAVGAADQLGYPVTLALLTADIPGQACGAAERTGLRSSEEVAKAFGRLSQGIPTDRRGDESAPMMVQAALGQTDALIRIASRQVASFGPAILFGTGGLRTELSVDVAIGLPPLNRLLARRLMENTRIYRVIEVTRPACIPLLEELLVNFSHLITDFPEILELEISPLAICGDHAWACNAAALLTRAAVASPAHLIISSYPDEYEFTAITKTGIRLFIRPVKPEDAPLLQELWSTLSSRSLYYRFLSPVRELAPDLLVRFTQIDYDREVALVALETTDRGERMLGVARLMSAPGSDTAEYSIVVGDPWQGQGVGAQLLSRLAAIAVQRGFKTLWGLVLRENRAMLELARKLGWPLRSGEDASEVEVHLDLTTVRLPDIQAAAGESPSGH
jgi:acetyltransferase